MKDIFMLEICKVAAAIFGTYIFGNYSFGKYFLGFTVPHMISLKKNMGIFMTIGDPCGNLENHLDMAPFTWLASHRVWEIHGAECLGKTWGTVKKQGPF